MLIQSYKNGLNLSAHISKYALEIIPHSLVILEYLVFISKRHLDISHFRNLCFKNLNRSCKNTNVHVYCIDTKKNKEKISNVNIFCTHFNL